MIERRRQPRTDTARRPGSTDHALTVRNNAGQLEVTCACGTKIGGRRDTDRQTITLSDLLELVRLHHANG